MNPASHWKGVALAAAMAGSLARAQTTERVSVDSSGAQGDQESGYFRCSISADGRFMAFPSRATNLVPGDTDGSWDIFVRDLQSGTTERVSVDSAGAEANHASYSCSISADGRFVTFESTATNLVTGDTNAFSDIFVRDRQSATTERVSVDSAGAETNQHSYAASISADGRFVAFWSAAWNLVASDTNDTTDFFVRDRQNGTTELVSVATGGAQGNSLSDGHVSISADARFVAFESFASSLVAGDTNAKRDIFVRDRQSGTTERVSVATGGAEGDAFSGDPAISADGRFVAFESGASNLVAGDTNGFYDVFVHDRQTATTERVSLATGGAQGDNPSSSFSISADGRFVLFGSEASNLVAGDTNGFVDVFVRDRGQPPIVAFCFGDGSTGACPCGNNGSPGAGCQNSASTGGAVLTATGSSSLSSDTLVLTSSGELPTVLSLFLQGDTAITGANFGDGLRCVQGNLKRLYVRNASGGVVSAPQPGDPSISARSAALGDPIPTGATRHYQTYYRDPDLAFCPSPLGNAWNISNALSAVWSP